MLSLNAGKISVTLRWLKDWLIFSFLINQSFVCMYGFMIKDWLKRKYQLWIVNKICKYEQEWFVPVFGIMFQSR